jgi:26S proteasome regulatory subunit N3
VPPPTLSPSPNPTTLTPFSPSPPHSPRPPVPPQALRKAPPSAVGFRTLAQKFALVVQLLMGEIPERALFAAPDMRAALRPYLALTRAVRLGDLPAFSAAVSSGSSVFSADGTLTLVRRLEATVVKAGLRKIATSYARISFADVARKLGLGSPEDAEFLAAKAIRDGVLDGVLDHAAGTLESRGAPNVYGGKEPQEAFHRRITFCLDVHAEAVRAMRYPPSAARADLESAEAKAEREREEEFINELAEGKDLDDDEEED